MWCLPRGSRMRFQSRAATEAVLLGLVRPPVSNSGPDLSFPPTQGATGPLRRGNVGIQPLLNTTSGGFLKQPDKQKTSSAAKARQRALSPFDCSLAGSTPQGQGADCPF